MKRKSISVDDVLKAVRKKCLECSGNDRSVVENCTIDYCPIYPYRSVKAVYESEEVTTSGQISMLEML